LLIGSSRAAADGKRFSGNGKHNLISRFHLHFWQEEKEEAYNKKELEH
jgi:hypothetical protein